MCDQKTAEGFSFHSTAQIYRQQQQGDKHPGGSEPLPIRTFAGWTQKPKRSMLLACFTETVQQVLKSVRDLFGQSTTVGFSLKAEEWSSFWGLDLSLTGAAAPEQQTIHNIDNQMVADYYLLTQGLERTETLQRVSPDSCLDVPPSRHQKHSSRKKRLHFPVTNEQRGSDWACLVITTVIELVPYAEVSTLAHITDPRHLWREVKRSSHERPPLMQLQCSFDFKLPAIIAEVWL